MEMRDRLIELIKNARKNTKGANCDIERNMLFADHLLANGVIVQEWISVKDMLPKEDNRVLVWLGIRLYDYTQIDTDRLLNGRFVRWGNDVTHWMPLPNPPKEEAEKALKERVDNG